MFTYVYIYIYIYADVELYSYQYVSISIFFHIICLPMSLVPPASGCEPSDKIEMRACNTQSCCWAVVCSQNRCGLGLVGRMIFFICSWLDVDIRWFDSDDDGGGGGRGGDGAGGDDDDDDDGDGPQVKNDLNRMYTYD